MEDVFASIGIVVSSTFIALALPTMVTFTNLFAMTLLLLGRRCCGFGVDRGSKGAHYSMIQTELSSATTSPSTEVDLEAVASKFKILTCSATSCAKKRKVMGQDSLSTFCDLYTRISNGGFANVVEIEESSCLGGCKMAPCVAVEHDDFVGTVALEGMTDNEFVDRLFHNVVTDDDADRVWSSVDNGIRLMAEEEQDEDSDDDEYDIDSQMI